MWLNIRLDKPLTLGKLRELVNNELSKFPDDTIILCPQQDVRIIDENPIKHIIGDNNSINFYNY